jgi:glutathione S-transferase
MTYDLWYWTGIPGRGEFVRLALEAGSIPYRDRAREEGDAAMIADMGRRANLAPFAPPYLVAGELCIAQTANILLFLGDRHLGPKDEAARHAAQMIQLTVADMVVEAHNVHHPVAPGLYYRDQMAEAARAAEAFREARMPKYLGWFERVLTAGGGPWLLGDAWTYADLSLFQLLEGLAYAFPKRMATLAADIPLTAAHRERVRALPELQHYLHSERRLPFNEDGLFRYYPELDGD